MSRLVTNKNVIKPSFGFPKMVRNKKIWFLNNKFRSFWHFRGRFIVAKGGVIA
jgi:hypothetical protein